MKPTGASQMIPKRPAAAADKTFKARWISDDNRISGHVLDDYTPRADDSELPNSDTAHHCCVGADGGAFLDNRLL